MRVAATRVALAWLLVTSAGAQPRGAPEPPEEAVVGVLPFVLGELVVIALVILFPEIALWLPGQMR